MNRLLKKSLKISSIYFALIFGIPIVFFSIILIIHFSTSEKHIQFYPLNDPQATYTVTYKYSQYNLDYKGTKSVISHTAYILSSPIDLNSYIGKEVSVKGDFITSDMQCIAHQCTKLAAKWAGVRIDSVYIK